MTASYTAIVKQSENWWIGWVEEIPGVNAQEKTKAELLVSLRQGLEEALEFNREDAREAAGSDYSEVPLVV
jgi:predicted RNase H-like HicB family nuclease